MMQKPKPEKRDEIPKRGQVSYQIKMNTDLQVPNFSVILKGPDSTETNEYAGPHCVIKQNWDEQRNIFSYELPNESARYLYKLLELLSHFEKCFITLNKDNILVEVSLNEYHENNDPIQNQNSTVDSAVLFRAKKSTNDLVLNRNIKFEGKEMKPSFSISNDTMQNLSNHGPMNSQKGQILDSIQSFATTPRTLNESRSLEAILRDSQSFRDSKKAGSKDSKEEVNSEEDIFIDSEATLSSLMSSPENGLENSPNKSKPRHKLKDLQQVTSVQEKNSMHLQQKHNYFGQRQKVSEHGSVNKCDISKLQAVSPQTNLGEDGRCNKDLQSNVKNTNSIAKEEVLRDSHQNGSLNMPGLNQNFELTAKPTKDKKLKSYKCPKGQLKTIRMNCFEKRLNKLELQLKESKEKFKHMEKLFKDSEQQNLKIAQEREELKLLNERYRRTFKLRDEKDFEIGVLKSFEAYLANRIRSRAQVSPETMQFLKNLCSKLTWARQVKELESITYTFMMPRELRHLEYWLLEEQKRRNLTEVESQRLNELTEHNQRTIVAEAEAKDHFEAEIQKIIDEKATIPEFPSELNRETRLLKEQNARRKTELEILAVPLHQNLQKKAVQDINIVKGQYQQPEMWDGKVFLLGSNIIGPHFSSFIKSYHKPDHCMNDTAYKLKTDLNRSIQLLRKMGQDTVTQIYEPCWDENGKLCLHEIILCEKERPRDRAYYGHVIFDEDVEIVFEWLSALPDDRLTITEAATYATRAELPKNKLKRFTDFKKRTKNQYKYNFVFLPDFQIGGKILDSIKSHDDYTMRHVWNDESFTDANDLLNQGKSITIHRLYNGKIVRQFFKRIIQSDQKDQNIKVGIVDSSVFPDIYTGMDMVVILEWLKKQPKECFTVAL